jgi:sugar phosphate isomerase/epimerase
MTDRPSISIATSFQYDIPIEQQIPLIAEAGFSHVALGVKPEHSGYRSREARASLKRQLEERGLKVDSLHASRLDAPEASGSVSASVEAAAELGAGCVVAHAGPFHCGTEGFAERLHAVLVTCEALVSVLRGNGMVLAIENVMPGPATDLATQAITELDPTIFGFCYDSAHDQIDGPRPFDLIDRFRDRIFSVHLSDRIKAHVDHVIPGEGFINWSRVCAGLRLAHYRGSILMEVMMQHSRYQEPAIFLQKVYAAGVDTWERVHSVEAPNQQAQATR